MVISTSTKVDKFGHIMNTSNPFLDRGVHYLNKGGRILSHSWIGVITTSRGVDEFNQFMDKVKYIADELVIIWTTEVIYMM